jgi:hypothetical protein
MIINDLLIQAEVEAEFAAYEQALIGNDVAALDRFFLDSEHAIRYGVAENLYGYEAIQAFRAGRSPTGLARKLERAAIASPMAATSRSPPPCSGATMRRARSGGRCRPGRVSPRAGKVLADIAEAHADAGAGYEPAALILELVRNKRRFADLATAKG